MSAKAEAEGVGRGGWIWGTKLKTEWGNLLIVECAGCQFGEFGAQMFADCKGYAGTTLATISQAGTHTRHTHTHTHSDDNGCCVWYEKYAGIIDK